MNINKLDKFKDYIEVIGNDDSYPKYTIQLRLWYKEFFSFQKEYNFNTNRCQLLTDAISETVEHLNSLQFEEHTDERIINILARELSICGNQCNLSKDIFLLEDYGFCIRNGISFEDLVMICKILSKRNYDVNIKLFIVK